MKILTKLTTVFISLFFIFSSTASYGAYSHPRLYDSTETINKDVTYTSDNNVAESYTSNGFYIADEDRTETFQAAKNTTSGKIYTITFTNNLEHYGGAIRNIGTVNFNSYLNGTKSSFLNIVFSSNTAKTYKYTKDGKEITEQPLGGAIYNTGTINFDSGCAVEFKDNTTIDGTSLFGKGGAIYNGTNGNINFDCPVSFSNNTSGGSGGAIYNGKNGKIIFNKHATFDNNIAQYSGGTGGAIYNSLGTITLSNVTFSSNTAKSSGGAIYNYEGVLSISNYAKFNYNVGQYGGAIYNYGEATTPLTIGTDAQFLSNTARNSGGAIYNSRADIVIGERASFVSNAVTDTTTQYKGGGIYNEYGNITIGELSKFKSNSAKYGGAIYTIADIGKTSLITLGKDITFSSNISQNGGAINNDGTAIITIEDGAVFNDNIATTNGGAIYNVGIINLYALTSDIEFTDNVATLGEAIYNTESGTVNLFSQEGEKIIFNDTIAGSGTIDINKDTENPGTIELNENMESYYGTINLYSGKVKIGSSLNNSSTVNGTFFNKATNVNIENATIDTTNSRIDTNSLNNLEVTNNLYLAIDIDTSTNQADNYTITGTNSGTIIVNSINFIGEQKEFSAQVLSGGNFTLTLSDELINQYNKTDVEQKIDSVSNNVKWDDKFYTQKRQITKSLNVVDNNTIKYLYTSTDWQNETSLGDTLNLINTVEMANQKTFSFDTANDVYTATTSPLETLGMLYVYGVKDNKGNLSTIDLNNNKGFTVSNTNSLDLLNVRIKNASDTAIYNLYKTGVRGYSAKFENNSTNGNGGAIYNGPTGELVLNPGNNNTIEFTGNKANLGEAIYNDGGTILLYIDETSKIIFNDTIAGTGSIVISPNSDIEVENLGTIELNAGMNDYTGQIKLLGTGSIIKIGSYNNDEIKKTGTWFNNANSVVIDNATIEMVNNNIQRHNFNNLSINNKLYLSIDVDFQTEQMDTITASNFTKEADKSIEITKFNVLNSTNKDSVTMTFTDSENIFNEIYTDVKNIKIGKYQYDVEYNDDGTFTFSKVVTALAPKIEVDVVRVGGYIMQSNVMNQAFTSMEEQKIIDRTSSNRIITLEDGLWIRPFGMQETVQVEGAEIETKSYGTLAGVDIELGSKELLNVYAGVAGSQEKLYEITTDQLGAVAGASFMFIEDNWYVGVTANVGLNTATVKEENEEDKIDMMMYSVGVKAAYDIALGRVLSIEPGVSAWYGISNSKEYESKRELTTVEAQTWTNIEAKPQIRFKTNLGKGWLPYLYGAYVFNLGEKGENVSNRQIDEFGKDNYVEYGAGINKRFGTTVDVYVQGTGRSGGREGYGANAGIKFMFDDPSKIRLQERLIEEEMKKQTEGKIREEVRVIQLKEQARKQKEALLKAEEEKKIKQEILEAQLKEAQQKAAAKKAQETKNVENNKKTASASATVATKKINSKNSVKFVPVFKKGKAELTPECQWEIEQLVEKLNKNKKLNLIVEIKESNAELANKKAQKIATIFINEYQIKNKIKINKTQNVVAKKVIRNTTPNKVKLT